MENYKYLISTTLYLRGKLLDPAKITQVLLVEPTKAFKKGDLVISPTSEMKSARKTGLWALEKSDRSNTTSIVSDQLKDILGELARWDPNIIQDCFIEDHFIDIYLAVNCKDIYTGNCTFILDKNNVDLVSKFGFSISVTVDTVQGG